MEHLTVYDMIADMLDRANTTENQAVTNGALILALSRLMDQVQALERRVDRQQAKEDQPTS